MKAIQFKFTPGDHCIVDDVDKPTPAKDEVLIKVVNSALDTAHQPILDKDMTAYFIHKLKEPLYLGYHYSGTIESVGSDVTAKDLKAGTHVFGFLQYDPSQTQGAFAEYITVQHDECAVKPKDVSFEIAAASATESLTALQAIRDLGGLRKDDSKEERQTILIVGAGGGVGSAAVQIAKNLLGAHVTAVCSARDARDAKQVKQVWGADVVLDRTSDPDYAKRLRKERVKFDVIFDAANALPSRATNLLKPKGAIVNSAPTVTFLWNKIKLFFSSKRASWVLCHSNEEDLDVVGKLLASRDLQIPIDSTFKVKDMSSAMLKQVGRKKGRVVIQVENGWSGE